MLTHWNAWPNVATQDEVRPTVNSGEQVPAKFGRSGFRRNLPFEGVWHGRVYATKQVEAYAVEEAGDWLVIHRRG